MLTADQKVTAEKISKLELHQEANIYECVMMNG
jgi:hypothetical protein